MQAPLGRGAGARLAIEVSRGGGLGTLGASWTEPAILREQIRSIARATEGPFCVNLVLDFDQDERRVQRSIGEEQEGEGDGDRGEPIPQRAVHDGGKKRDAG